MIPRWLALSALWVFGIVVFAVVSPLEIEREVGMVDRFLKDIPPGSPPTG
jgi:hypothetical protein